MTLNDYLRPICLILSALAMMAGGLGMALSFLFLTENNSADLTAGSAGFIAGAVLIGSGLISLSQLVSAPASGAVREPAWAKFE